jgi:hypothetical protein
MKNVVQSNFEAPDEAYSAAKEITLKFSDDKPLRLALVPYNDIRLKGLEELETSNQSNRAYVGVMLGSFLIQMLSERDGIKWYDLVDPEQLKRIKEFAVPAYFRHLADFDDSDIEPVRNYDAYSNFFVEMATESRSLVSHHALSKAAENMSLVYERNDKSAIASKWRELYEL